MRTARAQPELVRIDDDLDALERGGDPSPPGHGENGLDTTELIIRGRVIGTMSSQDEPTAALLPPAPATSRRASLSAPHPSCPTQALDRLPYRRWPLLVLLVYAGAWTGSAFAFEVVPQALPTLQGVAGVTSLATQSLMSTFAAGGIASAVPAGLLADRVGRINVLRVSLLSLFVTNLMMMASRNIYYLSFVMFLRGAAFTATGTTAPTYLAEMLPLKVRTRSQVAYKWGGG